MDELETISKYVDGVEADLTTPDPSTLRTELVRRRRQRNLALRVGVAVVVTLVGIGAIVAATRDEPAQVATQDDPATSATSSVEDIGTTTSASPETPSLRSVLVDTSNWRPVSRNGIPGPAEGSIDSEEVRFVVGDGEDTISLLHGCGNVTVRAIEWGNTGFRILGAPSGGTGADLCLLLEDDAIHRTPLPVGLDVSVDLDYDAGLLTLRSEDPSWELTLAGGVRRVSDREGDWADVFLPSEAAAGDRLDAETSTTVPRPVVQAAAIGDGTTMLRVEAADGSVFAVRLPETFGDKFTVTQTTVPDAIVSLVGNLPSATNSSTPESALGIRIEIGFCTDESLTFNALGLEAAAVRLSKPPPSLFFCRSDEFVRLVIDPVPDVEINMDYFDIIPVATGDQYVDWIATNMGIDDQCCFENRGPMPYQDTIIVSDGYGSTQLTALDTVSLVPLWTIDLANDLPGQPEWAGDSSYLEAVTESGIVIATTGHGYLQGLSALTGERLWTVDLAGETPGGLTMVGQDELILASSITTEGDTTAPTIRSVDIATGQELWAVEGNPGTELQWQQPLIYENMVVVADVPSYQENPESSATASVTAFDLSTGARLWTSPLDSTQEAFAPYQTLVGEPFQNLLLAVDSEGTLVRLEPETGERLWSVNVGVGPVTALSPETVSLNIRGQEVDVDLDTGQIQD